MSSKEFEEECSNKIGGWLWDETFAEGYSYPITLSVREMRSIANLIRRTESKPCQSPVPFKDEEESYHEPDYQD